jgi:hypothetical protein
MYDDRPPGFCLLCRVDCPWFSLPATKRLWKTKQKKVSPQNNLDFLFFQIKKTKKATHIHQQSSTI